MGVKTQEGTVLTETLEKDVSPADNMGPQEKEHVPKGRCQVHSVYHELFHTGRHSQGQDQGNEK